MKKILFIIIILSYATHGISQVFNTDSLEKLFQKSKFDTNRVKLMWQLAYAINTSNPERALQLGQNALYLSRKLNDTEGESRSLGVVANTFLAIGNYPRALEYNLEKLQLEEKRNNPGNMASVLLNIGAVYAHEEEFRAALKYYFRSDSIINKNNLENLKFYSNLNLGDAFNKLNIPDSAYRFFQLSLDKAIQLNDSDFIGTALTGMANTSAGLDSSKFALNYYRTAISYLSTVNDDEVLCEAYLGLAKLYLKTGNNDSAGYYARQSMNLASKDGFLAWELQSAGFMAGFYKSNRIFDSAFHYLDYVEVLNDSMNSKAKIRELQVLSSNEQIRQLEIEENKKISEKERHVQLQLMFIAIFIPGFFLLTLLLSRIRIHVRVIKVLGILSLLLLFEYLTLLLHPYVAEITHHTPVYEMLIFVSIAAILIPMHHRFEHWLIEKLTSHNEKTIRLKTVKLKPHKET